MGEFTEVSSWVQSHKGPAAAGGAGVLVVVYALYKRHQSTAAAAAAVPTAAVPSATAVDPTTGLPYAGSPGLQLSDVQNAVQDQINGDENQIRQALAGEVAQIPAGKTGKTGATGPAQKTLSAGQLAQAKAVAHAQVLYAEQAAQKAHAQVLIEQRAALAKSQARKPPAGAPRKPAPTPPAGQTYTVRAGDTLSGIADKYGRPLSAVEAANRAAIPNPNLIRPGQVIKL